MRAQLSPVGADTAATRWKRSSSPRPARCSLWTRCESDGVCGADASFRVKASVTLVRQPGVPAQRSVRHRERRSGPRIGSTRDARSEPLWRVPVVQRIGSLSQYSEIPRNPGKRFRGLGDTFGPTRPERPPSCFKQSLRFGQEHPRGSLRCPVSRIPKRNDPPAAALLTAPRISAICARLSAVWALVPREYEAG